MATDKYLTYRGDVRALAVTGGVLALATVHPEGQPTALYRIDPEKGTLAEDHLDAGALAVLVADDDVWLAGSDQRLYRAGLTPGGKGAPKSRGGAFDAPITALAPLAGARLAVASGAKVHVVARKDAKVLQTLDLPEPVTALASDPTGQWLVAGTVKGTVAVFESETDANELRPSDSAPLHDAAVTALLFETDELRFLSTGADQKLLSTHARGRLEAEDRGKGAMHEQPVSAMIAGPLDRFLTGSSDGSLKSWPRARGARPITLKDGVGKVVALAVVTVHGKPEVAAACHDNTVRLFRLDDEGKFDEATTRFRGADDWAKNELSQGDPKRREAALKALAGFADLSSLKRMAAQMTSDADHALRLLACRLLGDSKHPRAARALEKGLEHREEAVRLLAFEGLRRHVGPTDLRPLALALKADKADVGVKAVEALEGLAPKDDQAMARLTGALESNVPEVRQAALTSLEKVHPKDSPEASLTALGVAHADLRRLALVRLYQRGLLSDPRVQAALRWRGDDPDPEVRRVAFLLSLHTREKLLHALRESDPELKRQLADLESGVLPAAQGQAGGRSKRKGDRSATQTDEAETESEESEAPQLSPDVATSPIALGALTDPNSILALVDDLVRRGALPPPMAEMLRQRIGSSPLEFLSMFAGMKDLFQKQKRSHQKPEGDQ
jgi:ParB family chromosome partitioning protein